MKHATTQEINSIGVDIAKAELVCCFMAANDHTTTLTNTFQNTPAGHKKFIAWTNKIKTTHPSPLNVIMEATSSYWEAFASSLHHSGISVSVVQPLRIAHFTKVLLKRSKSDPADAKTIALYGIKISTETWAPLSKTHQQAKALSRRIKQLQKQLHAENNHLEHTSDPYCIKDINANIKQLKTKIQSAKKALQELMPKDPTLNEQYELLQTIPGIAAQSASQIIAELPNLTEFEDARQLAAWGGLTPKHHQSGKSSKSRTPISKIGSNHLREALFFPALVGVRYNSILRAFRDRLIAKGKTKLEAVCAAMRKLIHIIYGMLKHKKSYDPKYINPSAKTATTDDAIPSVA